MNIVLGTMNINYQYTSNKNNNIDYYNKIINKYINSVSNPILDSAFYYGNNETEKTLGQIKPNVKITTKANPWFNNDFTNGYLGQLSSLSLEKQLNISLKNLRLEKVDIFFLHCPDYETDIYETLEKCDELWRHEKFDYLGISNYSYAQLNKIINICENDFFESPTYYQGMYNLISRNCEELFPLLNNYGIEFWAYNPLAGGLLTNKYKDNIIIDNSRFNNPIYQNIFWKKEILNKLTDFNNINNYDHTHLAYNWLRNHSKLRPNDKIIMGVSTIEQLEHNLQFNNFDIDINTLNILNNIYDKNIAPNYYY